MTPEEKENALRAQARRCAEEITKAMSVKPKPKWNAVCPPHPSQALREGKADGCQPGEICQCYWPHEQKVWSGIMKLTQERLKDLLRYEPGTGNFYWLNPTAKRMHHGELAGFVDYNGYVYIKVDSKRHSAHRLAWLYVYGHFPSNFIDHINTVRSDNRISNLREATRSQNMMNRSVGKNSKSGVKGIGWDKKSQKWRARCQADGKRKDVGFFDSIEEAKNYLALYRSHAHGAFANDGGGAA